MASSLREKQSVFVCLIGRLIEHAYREGYELTFGQALRTKEEAELNAKRGVGISNSLHRKKLAIDLNLFKKGRFLSKTKDHRKLGEYWESLSTPGFECCWGGRFGDGNHYSIKHLGVK